MPKIPYKEAVNEDEPISYWRMDSATELKDQEVAANHGVLNGEIPTAEGALVPSGDADTSNSFSNNANNFWNIPATATTLELTEAFSVECWVYPEQLNGGIFEKTVASTENTSYKIDMEASTGTISALIQKGGLKIFRSTAPAPQKEWTYVVLTYDGTNARLWINGTESNKLAIAAPINTGEGICNIGKVQNGNPWKGRIDELAIYGTALSEARIAAHYSAAQAEEATFAASGAIPRAGHKHPAIRIGALA